MSYRKICGIYLITCASNGRRYVGQSVSVKHRLSAHKNKLRKTVHSNPIMQNCWNKYGEDSFLFEVIEQCSEELLDAREQYWMVKLQSFAHQPKGMNIYKEGNSEARKRQVPVSAERKAKQIETRTRRLEAFGKTKTYLEWSEVTGLSVDCIRSRMKRGQSLEEALSKPNDKFKILTVAGETGTIRQLSQKFKIKQNVVVNRIYLKWCPTRAFLLPNQRLVA